MLLPYLIHWDPPITISYPSYPISPIPPQDLPRRRCIWCFASASCEDLGRYYADFPWNDYGFRATLICAEHITEVIVSGTEAYIPHSFST
ncbi:hypothetical protein E2C01_064495 [Portunus trituberculatus]|uniref:Uncharacterized protein n=1 Tax=Portunus trituberculatus TaxID=210409 RepID=A0A5B7HJ90_PORTR|nr:hypothetical protein [Portunus trituberculatus]